MVITVDTSTTSTSTGSTRTAQKKRYFGGKAGTWFRKKRAFPPAEEEDDDRESNENKATGTKKKTNPNVASKIIGGREHGANAVIIGWDDVRCRPIYNNQGHASTQSTSSTSNKISSPESLLVNDQDNDDNNEHEEGGRSVFPSFGKEHSVSRTQNDGVAKTFRSRRQWRISQDDGNISESHFTAATTTCPESASSSQNTTSNEYNKLVLDDLEKENEINSGKKADEEKMESSPRRVSNVHEISGIDHNYRPESAEKSIFDFHEEDDEPGPSKAKRINPISSKTKKDASTTSLNGAREFFRRLDGHPLTVMAVPGTSPRRQKQTNAGRSSRRNLSIENLRNLSNDYNEYSAACRESSVSPMPRDQFTKNRASFFQTTEFYDGFLDEMH